MKNTMTTAWTIRNSAATKWNCEIMEIHFGLCLQMAHKGEKIMEEITNQEKIFRGVVIDDMASELVSNYKDEKDSDDFNAKSFMRYEYNDAKGLWGNHPSMQAASLCENLTYEQTSELFDELFKAAWVEFVKRMKK